MDDDNDGDDDDDDGDNDDDNDDDEDDHDVEELSRVIAKQRESSPNTMLISRPAYITDISLRVSGQSNPRIVSDTSACSDNTQIEFT